MGSRSGLVVLLLVVVWLVALVPVALRKFSEWRITASVAEFHHRSRAMGRARPVAAGNEGAAARAAERDDPAELDRLRGRERARRRERVARRRRALRYLLVTLTSTFVLGAIPALRALWDLSLITFLMTTGYLALLVRVERERMSIAAESERAEKVVQMHAHRRGHEPDGAVEPVARHAVGVGVLPPARPAFVLVDMPG